MRTSPRTVTLRTVQFTGPTLTLISRDDDGKRVSGNITSPGAAGRWAVTGGAAAGMRATRARAAAVQCSRPGQQQRSQYSY